MSAHTGQSPAGFWDKARAQIRGTPPGPSCSGVAWLWLGSQPTGERGRHVGQGHAVSRKEAGRSVGFAVLTLSLYTVEGSEATPHRSAQEVHARDHMQPASSEGSAARMYAWGGTIQKKVSKARKMTLGLSYKVSGRDKATCRKSYLFITRI